MSPSGRGTYYEDSYDADQHDASCEFRSREFPIRRCCCRLRESLRHDAFDDDADDLASEVDEDDQGAASYYEHDGPPDEEDFAVGLTRFNEEYDAHDEGSFVPSDGDPSLYSDACTSSDDDDGDDVLYYTSGSQHDANALPQDEGASSSAASQRDPRDTMPPTSPLDPHDEDEA